jgi:uncharacterized protein (DUF433 family)
VYTERDEDEKVGDLYRGTIVTDPDVMMGKPVIVGTRITVELILEKLAEGESVEQIASEHPNLTAAHIRTALEYATLVYKSDVVYSVGA